MHHLPGSNGCPPQQRLDARHQLLHVERLGDVIIRPQLQADDLVDDFAARREQQDGRSKSRRTDVATKVQPIPARKHDVKNDQIEGQRRGFLVSLLPIGDKIHLIAVFAQAIAQCHAQRFFVFYQQNVFLHSCATRSAAFSAPTT